MIRSRRGGHKRDGAKGDTNRTASSPYFRRCPRRQRVSEAVGVLLDRRIGIIHGGEHAPEYRVPWVIRALASDVTALPRYADENVMAGLPPLLGPQLLHEVRERFQEEEETRHLFQ